VKKEAGLSGRWHDARHTFITELSEVPKVSQEAIRQLPGQTSRRMTELLELAHRAHQLLESQRLAERRKLLDVVLSKH
jgi:hypothetical protein